MQTQSRWVAVLLVGIVFVGCSSAPPPGGPRVKTYPVTGVVKVDGVPTQGIQIVFAPQEGADAKFAITTGTLEGGKISPTTYRAGDGLLCRNLQTDF